MIIGDWFLQSNKWHPSVQGKLFWRQDHWFWQHVPEHWQTGSARTSSGVRVCEPQSISNSLLSDRFQPIPTEPDISTSCVLVIALICQPGSLISFYDTIWKLFEYGGRQCMLNFSLLCRATRIWKFKNVISFCNTTIAQKIDMQDNCISQKPRQKQKNIQIPLILYLHSIVYNVYPYSINLNLQTWKSEKKI